jgi:hypothetical protein
LMSLATLQVREHRSAPEGDGAAVGFNGHKGLSLAQGLVAVGDQPAVFEIPLDGLIRQKSGHHEASQHQCARDSLFHVPIVAGTRNFGPFLGSKL